eukprot:TRINITY_DN5332_c1_g1_i1.p1 TRINITY_DN5332_c1_g1~~TRINITY_DN5332_c1_g1_i1.p1  ORF type:complete len:814 (+),score=229.03 TRINITY_DN5332_c1_g1_i1:406-2847(+)
MIRHTHTPQTQGRQAMSQWVTTSQHPSVSHSERGTLRALVSVYASSIAGGVSEVDAATLVQECAEALRDSPRACELVRSGGHIVGLKASCKDLPGYVADAFSDGWDASSAVGTARTFGQCTSVAKLSWLTCAAHCALAWRGEDLGEFTERPIKLLDERPLLQLSDLPTSVRPDAPRAHTVGELRSYFGTVVRLSSVQPLCVQMLYVCPMCGAAERVRCLDGVAPEPPRCGGKECREKEQRARLSRGKYGKGPAVSLTKVPSPHNPFEVKWENHQRLKLQLMTEGSGRIPACVDVEVRGPLCDVAIPGDVIAVAGILRQDPLSGKGGKKGGGKGKGMQTQLHGAYLECFGIERAPNMNEAGLDADQTTAADLHAIDAISRRPDCFSFLVHSLSPDIHGHDLVKAGLLLTLLGGSPKVHEAAPRNDTHILVVGDPGVGKSQLLHSCARVSPRGVYVCGNSTTASGLTVTLQRDVTTGDSALEAGALVLGDQGVTCIDEFDKMDRAEHAALLEAMEQQRISVAKAGAVGTLPARTCVIAAANPHGGHYNDLRTVAENVRLSPALLSRFDLIFILKDSLTGGSCDRLTRHVLVRHGAVGDLMADPEFAAAAAEASEGLEARIQASVPDTTADAALVRKYIAHARRVCAPRLTPEASAALKEYYLYLRGRNDSRDSVLTTTRQLESLIRLSQARAKAELRDAVSRQHALDVVELMKRSLIQSCTDVETGQMDVMCEADACKKRNAQGVLQHMRDEIKRSGDPEHRFTRKALLDFLTKGPGAVGDDKAEQIIDKLNEDVLIQKLPASRSAPTSYTLLKQ